MNNRIQQRFDRSIREAVAQSEQAIEREHAASRRDVRVPLTAEERRAARRQPKGRLFLDPATGATVGEPAR